jgi:hypothetical protein
MGLVLVGVARGVEPGVSVLSARPSKIQGNQTLSKAKVSDGRGSSVDGGEGVFCSSGVPGGGGVVASGKTGVPCGEWSCRSGTESVTPSGALPLACRLAVDSATAAAQSASTMVVWNINDLLPTGFVIDCLPRTHLAQFAARSWALIYLPHLRRTLLKQRDSDSI